MIFYYIGPKGSAYIELVKDAPEKCWPQKIAINFFRKQIWKQENRSICNFLILTYDIMSVWPEH